VQVDGWVSAVVLTIFQISVEPFSGSSDIGAIHLVRFKSTSRDLRSIHSFS